MADENKISVNVSINGQHHIDQSTKAFDSLRISINNLSQPFDTFSNKLIG